MKKEELKKLIKPLVKECIQESIHEALFESGVITQVVSEVIRGVNIPQLVESMAPKARQVLTVPAPVELNETQKPTQMTAVMKGTPIQNPEAELQAQRTQHKAEMEDRRRKLEESLAGGLGINIFEGTTPALPDVDEKSSMAGVDPNDPGINLAAIPGLKTLNFSGQF